ncbi:hypothetical protein GY45DRAFT_1310770 [Cubamyces sp. BRFM 1775]|nr:hypothetical protein GY45DRAFT_1310770 [Cubamyces sp. BRFM 1775]
MKQAKLSFTSKRNSSTAAAAAGKKSKSGKSSSGHGSQASPEHDEPIDISDSDDEESVIPAAKKRRVGALRVRNVEPEPEPAPVREQEKEREPLNVSDKRWRKVYGAARGKMGNIEPVHVQGQSMVDHILRVFDLSYEYGPCVGVSRLDRWERAHALGLNPPPEVKEILVTKEGTTEDRFSQSVFHGEV